MATQLEISLPFHICHSSYFNQFYNFLPQLAAAQTQKAFIGSATEYPGKDSSDEKKKVFEETFSEMKAWANDGFEPSGHKGLIPLPGNCRDD